jgi:methyl-accepting chemotaxis protein
MHFLQRLSLARRLIVLMVFFLAAMVLTGVVGISMLKQISERQNSMYDDNLMPMQMMDTATRQMAIHFRRIYPYVFPNNDGSRKATVDLNQQAESDIDRALDYLRAHPNTPELKALTDQVEQTWPLYKASMAKVRAAADAGDTQAALAEIATNTDRLHVAVRDPFLKVVGIYTKAMRDEIDGTAHDVDVTIYTQLAVLLSTVVLGSILGTMITRSVVTQIGGDPLHAMNIARRIASGDLRNSFQVSARDRSSLLYHLSAMRHQVATIIHDVRGAAQSVAQASQQISAGTLESSSRTEEQASAQEETAASMEQLGSTVRQNADNAQTANQLALSASSVAAEGGEVVTEVVRTMKDIHQSSAKIADIIGVIDGIAFQTNILALNAAVEAARAGEQGRGFAVVAGEVRSLAQRSAAAAREIKTLITASVEHGSELADKAGATMNEVVNSIRRVTDIVGEISSASREQSIGVGQVSEAMVQMDQATQQNAALIEETSAAAESLKHQAQQLVEAVAVFQLDGHSDGHGTQSQAQNLRTRPGLDQIKRG